MAECMTEKEEKIASIDVGNSFVKLLRTFIVYTGIRAD